MIEVIIRGLAKRRVRALLTALAVVLGVAMISGTFVLMDTVMSGYASIFRTAYVHTGAVVVALAPFGATGTAKPALPASLVTRIRNLPTVQRAHGYIDAHAQLTNASGTPVGKPSQEASLFGIPVGELDAMNPLTLVKGHWPRGDGQVIVDEATATANNLRTGTVVGLVARKPLERFQVVGIFRFAGAVALGPTQFLAVDLPVAQQIFDKRGLVDEIDVAARPGVTVPSPAPRSWHRSSSRAASSGPSARSPGWARAPGSPGGSTRCWLPPACGCPLAGSSSAGGRSRSASPPGSL